MFIDFYGFLHWRKSCLLLKTTLQNIIHAFVFLHASNQMVSSRNSNHEMTWLNPQLQNFHFYQSDKFSAKSLSWHASSSQCWRLFWCFFCMSCRTGCISIFISFFYHILLKSSLKYFMHNMEFLIGFYSDQLSNLIHFVNKSGLLKRKENFYLVQLSKHIVYRTSCYTLTIHICSYFFMMCKAWQSNQKWYCNNFYWRLSFKHPHHLFISAKQL